MSERVTMTDAIPGGMFGLVQAVKGEEILPSREAQSAGRPARNAAGRQAAEEMARLAAKNPSLLQENLSQALNVFNIEARYYLDKTTNREVVQIRDKETHRLIRQVPSEEFLDHLRTLNELVGLLFDLKA